MKCIVKLIAILNNKVDVHAVPSCCSSSSWQKHFSRCLPFSSIWSGAGLPSIIASARINFWWSCLFRVLNSFSSPCNSRIWPCRWATTSWVAGRQYIFPNDRDGFARIGNRDLLTSWKHTHTQQWTHFKYISFSWSYKSHPDLVK